MDDKPSPEQVRALWDAGELSQGELFAIVLHNIEPDTAESWRGAFSPGAWLDFIEYARSRVRGADKRHREPSDQIVDGILVVSGRALAESPSAIDALRYLISVSYEPTGETKRIHRCTECPMFFQSKEPFYMLCTHWGSPEGNTVKTFRLRPPEWCPLRTRPLLLAVVE